jgi:hypothetical protein
MNWARIARQPQWEADDWHREQWHCLGDWRPSKLYTQKTTVRSLLSEKSPGPLYRPTT